jgi:Ca2+/Na+ antiporter
MDSTANTTISIINVICSALSAIFVIAGTVFTYRMLRIMQRGLSKSAVPPEKNRYKNPQGSVPAYLSKSVWVFFTLPVFSIVYFLSWNQQPTQWSVVIVSFAVAVLLLNTITLFVARLVLRIAELDEKHRRTTEQMRETIQQPNLKQEELNNTVRSLQDRVKALEYRTRSPLDILAGLVGSESQKKEHSQS